MNKQGSGTPRGRGEPSSRWMRLLEEALQIASEALSAIGTADMSPFVKKGERDYSTKGDFLVEQRVRDFLQTSSKKIPVIGEETSPSIGDYQLAWVVDPIDGTVNYSRNHPLWGVSIALVSHQGSVVAGILLPTFGKKYLAELGGGAYLNGERIEVSARSKLSESIISVGDFSVEGGARKDNNWQIRILEDLAGNALRVRMHGSAAVDMCLVAEGICEASLTLSNKIWDIQAGALLVREAGGVVTDHLGRPHDTQSPSTLATTLSLKEQLIGLVSDKNVE